MTTPMTPAELAARALELDAAATPGPWEACKGGVSAVFSGAGCRIRAQLAPVEEPADAAFISESRTLPPALARALQVAEAQRDLARSRWAVLAGERRGPEFVRNHDAVIESEARLRALGVPEGEW